MALEAAAAAAVSSHGQPVPRTAHAHVIHDVDAAREFRDVRLCSRLSGCGQREARGRQPPMVVMGRSATRAISCMPACRACLRARAPRTSASTSASEAPARSASRRDTSRPPKRQTLRLPSAVTRRRLQPLQKCSVMDEMKDTRPRAPGPREKLRAVSEACVRTGSSAKPSARRRSLATAAGTSLASDQPFPPKGMYSMNRTSTGLRVASSAKAPSSWSFTPPRSTQFTLTGV
mmetsp:Transcript_17031/g.57175  ORF Transcript_17031/g.57175 Transcript_17031/m.57175 type:complete len:233 (-) Transcript_17031:564-1262(-)